MGLVEDKPSDSNTSEAEFIEHRNRRREHPSKLYQAGGQEYNPKECVYCGDAGHKSIECQTINSTDERQTILAKKNLCFNCATPNHRAAKCYSKSTCQHCRKRHHTSICDRKQILTSENGEKKTLMAASGCKEGILPLIPKVDKKLAAR